MEAPPPVQPSPNRSSNNNTTKIIVGIALGLVGCFCLVMIALAVVLFPAFRSAKGSALRSHCLSNAKQLSLGVMMYSGDFDDRLPQKDLWMDQIDPYVRNRDVYRCPVLRQGQFGYAFLDQLSKTKTTDSPSVATQVMIFESPDVTWNAHSSVVLLPNPPRHVSSSVSYLDGACQVDSSRNEALIESVGITWLTSMAMSS